MNNDGLDAVRDAARVYSDALARLDAARAALAEAVRDARRRGAAIHALSRASGWSRPQIRRTCQHD